MSLYFYFFILVCTVRSAWALRSRAKERLASVDIIWPLLVQPPYNLDFVCLDRIAKHHSTSMEKAKRVRAGLGQPFFEWNHGSKILSCLVEPWLWFVITEQLVQVIITNQLCTLLHIGYIWLRPEQATSFHQSGRSWPRWWTLPTRVSTNTTIYFICMSQAGPVVRRLENEAVSSLLVEVRRLYEADSWLLYVIELWVRALQVVATARQRSVRMRMTGSRYKLTRAPCNLTCSPKWEIIIIYTQMWCVLECKSQMQKSIVKWSTYTPLMQECNSQIKICTAKRNVYTSKCTPKCNAC